MCGFAGQRFSDPMSAGDLERSGRAMIACVRHRGPDAEGLWVEPSGLAVLTFARLAIQDLSPDANQPMQSESRRYTIAYNGEIYNPDELRDLIARPASSFRTHCDTEVLLACIERMGIEPTLAAINGMFAFALWDAKTRSLYLVRDRIGKKPLHYVLGRGCALFASELKSILKVFPGPLTLDPDAVEAYFSLTYVPAPLSIFREIRKVRPGHIVEIRADMGVNERAYWSLNSVVESCPSAAPRRFTEVVEQADVLLEDAVRRRLISDVPVAVLLSGGVDSNLVAYMIGQRLRVPLQAFSIALEDPRLDEATQASAIAKQLNLSHTVLPLLKDESISLVDEVFGFLDEPFGDYSAIPTYAICKLARTKATVLLTGDGGDEVFGGYTRYIWGCGWRRLPAWLYGSWRRHKVLGSRAELAIEIYRRLLSLGSNGGSAHPDLFRRHAPGVTRESKLTVLQYLRLIDFETYLPDDILVKTDRMSMANSAELRSPFLDYRLVQLSWILRDNALVRGTIRKRITRELFRRHIGLNHLQLQKYGFGMPMGQWLLGPLREQVETAISELTAREDLPQIRALVKRYWPALQRGHKSAHHPIWLVYAFWRWSQNWEKQIGSGVRRGTVANPLSQDAVRLRHTDVLEPRMLSGSRITGTRRSERRLHSRRAAVQASEPNWSHLAARGMVTEET